MAGNSMSRRRVGLNESHTARTPPPWQVHGSASGRRALQRSTTTSQTKTRSKRISTLTSKSPTFSNSLVRAIFGRRTAAASRTRQVRTLANHDSVFCLGIEALWKESSLCDVVLRIDHHVLSAHRLILCTFSDFFYDAIIGEPGAPPLSTTRRPLDSVRTQTPQIEIWLNKLNPLAVQTVIECLYTGKIRISEENVRDLLDAAAYLKIKLITKEVEFYLCDNVTKDNCADMLSLSTTYQLKHLEDLSLKTVARNFIDVSLTDQFLELTNHHIMDIMSRNDLLVASEMEVFRAAMAWLETNDPPADVLEGIFKTIRLPLLSPQEIMDNVETEKYLMSNSRCQYLVKEALHYHCLPARQSVLQSARTAPRACRSYHAVLAIGGAPRLMQDEVSRSIHYYNPQIKEWTLLTRLPEPRHHHAVAILGGFLYVAGGERTNDQQSPTSSAYRFDPRTDTWLQIASMSTCRESFQLVVLVDMIYAIGGRLNQVESLSSVERYNSAMDEWQPVAALSSPRRSMAAACHNGRIYVMGGSGEKRISSKIERYNPLLNRWEPRRRLSCPRFFAQLIATKTKMFLVGGATVDKKGSVVGMPFVESYDPLSDTWTRLRQILEPRAEFGLALHANRLLILGGYSWDRQARLSSVEAYDLVENTSEYLPNIAKPFTGIMACALKLYHRLDGKPMYHKTEPPPFPRSRDKDELNRVPPRTSATTEKKSDHAVHVVASDLI